MIQQDTINSCISTFLLSFKITPYGGDVLNKLGIAILITGLALLGIMLGAYYFTEGAEKANTEEDPEETLPTELDKEEVEEQTQKIGGVSYNTGLSSFSSESEVVDVMHKMTHQKVIANEKWGAIPLIPDTIEQVYEIVYSSEFKIKDDLLEILEKWKAGDFSQAHKDHNYFWSYQDGTIGKALGVMSEEQEREFIINNFGEEYLVEAE